MRGLDKQEKGVYTIDMTDDIRYDLFAAKDVTRIIGIDSNKLFHWVQTKGLLKPTVQGFGRGKSNYFSLEDLATLSLIKILYDYKIDLWEIKSLLGQVLSPNPKIVSTVKIEDHTLFFYDDDGEVIPAPGVEPINVWQIYKKGKNIFDKEGLVLTIENPLDKREHISFIGLKTRKTFDLPFGYAVKPPIISCLAIDIISIVRNIEEKTGLRF